MDNVMNGVVSGNNDYDQNNVFAKIIRGEIPCQIVKSNEYAMAFHDIDPKADTHILVIPKGPYKDFRTFMHDGQANEIAGFFDLLQDILDEFNDRAGGKIVTNFGIYQEVPHLHFHVLLDRELKIVL